MSEDKKPQRRYRTTNWPQYNAALKARGSLTMCRIPDDCIDENRYPLFMIRAVLKELIESLPFTGSEKSC